MQNFGKWIGAGAIALAAFSTIAGCNNNGEADANVANNVAENTAQATSNVAQAASNTAANATNSVANAAANATNSVEGSVDAAVNTPKIKTALGASAALKGSNIDVDTDGTKNVITLKGTVTSAAQKTMAGSIAQKTAGPNFKINNTLTMAGGKM